VSCVGGNLISPCDCSGTQRFVHVRCLSTWVRTKHDTNGLDGLWRCELCLHDYNFGGRLPFRVSLLSWIQYRLQRLWRAIDRTPVVGPTLRFLDNAVLLYSVSFAFASVAANLPSLPGLVLICRKNPKELRPFAPQFAAALIMESLLGSHDYLFHVGTVALYGLGWLLDASCRILDIRYAQILSKRTFQFVTGALMVPKAIGLGLQTMNLSVMFFFGGLSSAYLDGMTRMIATPLVVLSEISGFGVKCLQRVSRALSMGMSQVTQR